MPEGDASQRPAAGRGKRGGDLAATLTAILDEEAEAGRHIRLWWRDDDAARPSPALGRLLDLADEYRAPLSLAVIPMAADESLAGLVEAHPHVRILQHGIRHANRARPPAKKAELTIDHPLAETLRELAEGRARLAALFGDRFKPVLVPPWNRASPAILELRAGVGLPWISMYGGFLPGRIDTHVDPIAWRGDRGYVGDARLLEMLREALAAARPKADTSRAAPPAAIGLLTHHLDHDAAVWEKVETFLAAATAHPAVRIVGIDDLLGDA